MANHILYVEDNPNDQRFVRKVLETNGYVLQVATNGEDGIRMARAETPALILVDLQMPGMDGMATVRLLRRVPGCEETPIVALTAYAEKYERQAYLDAGFTDYQLKQAGIKPLISLVQRFMAETPASEPAPDSATTAATPAAPPAAAPAPAEPVAPESPAATVPTAAPTAPADAPPPPAEQGEDSPPQAQKQE